MKTYSIRPRGAFSLAESAGFAFIDRDRSPHIPDLNIVFCRDSDFAVTGAHLTQACPDDDVEVEGDEHDRAQLERILGLDVDAAGFGEVGDRDPVVKSLQGAAPGLRPPVLPSAYEAAAWCILQARRAGVQARQMRRHLAEQAGTVVSMQGFELPCLPPPAALVDAAPVPGLDEARLQRLHGIARAALEGRLNTAELRAMDHDDARRRLEQLPGIGPFTSAIIVGRGIGHTDALFGPITELNDRVGQRYRLGHPASPAELADIASAWSPWRAWVQVYFRAVSPHMPDQQS